MAASIFAENTYSLRYSSSLARDAALEAGPDAQTLAAIEAALDGAHGLYLQGRYQQAVDAYKSAGASIYKYIDNNASSSASVYDRLSKDPALFDSLLSVSAQYMNLLPTATVTTVKPSVVPDPTKLAKLSVDEIGIRGAPLITVAASNSLAAARAQMTGTLSVPTDVLVQRPTLTPAPHPAPEPAAPIPTRTLGVLVGSDVFKLTWNAGSLPPIDQIKTNVYGARTKLAHLPDVLLLPQQPSDVALALPHDYYYIIPLGIAQALQALGDYAGAEAAYLQAASYAYINVTIEVPFVWLALANCYLQWGNALYIGGDPANAVTAYTNVIAEDDSVPASALYTLGAFAPVATGARTALAAIVAGTAVPATINPMIGAVIADVRAQLIKIKAGLDYFGMAANSVPIWTFSYLQSVAVTFANLAISAEQSYISFQSHADEGTVTQAQLQQTVVQAQGDVQAAILTAAATAAEQAAYADAASLATLRANDANATISSYSSLSWSQNLMQAESSQVQGGDNGDPGQLVGYLNQLQSGATISDSTATVGASLSLDAATYSRQYEIGQLTQTAAEMQAAAAQAQAETTAAAARTNAANAQTAASQLRLTGAQQVVAAFDAQTFTPDVWHAMALTMYGLYQRYFAMATRAAKLMQAAYNFETDQLLQIIRSSYGSDQVNGLLGADLLMADVQGFTYDLITSTAGKPQPIRHEISLATSYPYLFETQFRKTGAIDFETRVDDFDAAYPGTYAGRIESLEVAVDGIVPVRGIAGTLTNNGISTFRVPSVAWPTNGTPGVKFRVQSKETLVFSDYAIRNDGLLFRTNPNALQIFEGAGVASSWHLELPKAVNDIDYGALQDVRIIFYYQARFDTMLKSRVLAHLSSLPAVTSRSRSIPLAWLYPDAFFHFQDTGTLAITLANSDFPFNEQDPALTDIALLVTTTGVAASGIALTLATPGHPAPIAATTDANGQVASGSMPALTPLATGSALGTYTIVAPQAGNPGFVSSGKFDLSPIVNVSLVFNYTFTPRS